MISGKLRLGSFFLFLFACADAPTTFSHFRSVFNWTGRLHFSGESGTLLQTWGYACGRDSRIRTASSESIFSTSFFSSATFFFSSNVFHYKSHGRLPGNNKNNVYSFERSSRCSLRFPKSCMQLHFHG